MFQYSTKRKKKSNIFELALVFFMIKYNENKKIDISFQFFTLNENWMDEWRTDPPSAHTLHIFRWSDDNWIMAVPITEKKFLALRNVWGIKFKPYKGSISECWSYLS